MFASEMWGRGGEGRGGEGRGLYLEFIVPILKLLLNNFVCIYKNVSY